VTTTTQLEKEPLVPNGSQTSLTLAEREAMPRRANQGGFTLIELLIVIVILAILAAIVVFAVGSTTKNAIASSCNTDAKTVETAIGAYQANNSGAYPPSASFPAAYTTLTSGGYLRQAPPTTHYQIVFNSVGAVFALAPTAIPSTSTEISAAVSGGGTVTNVDVNPAICATFS
jgi:general secretion pathway protein G